MFDGLEKCKQIEECPNCFARTTDGGCKILCNTNFDKKCPFYKLKEQVANDLEKYKVNFRGKH